MFWKCLPLFLLCTSFLQAQTGQIRGSLQSATQEPLIFSNVAIYQQSDSTLVKVETSNESGQFLFSGIPAGQYRLVATYIGLPPLEKDQLSLKNGEVIELGVLQFNEAAVELETAVVKADRALVEMKPDRTIFNVQGTINSTGENALELLRKAPGVLVDNNENINVLGRAGVMIYIDGKQLPLQGADLTNYLTNLQADQIDRIEIITNPGARYDAEGNAGIIDIRMKKDKNQGSNGSLNTSFSQGRYHRMNAGGSGNYRNKRVNVFGNGNVYQHRGFNNINFLANLNGLNLDEINQSRHRGQGMDLRVGTDFFLGANHTVGVLVSGGGGDGNSRSLNRIEISPQATPELIDSILVARTRGDHQNRRGTANLNYSYDNRKGRTLNIDADAGQFKNENMRYLPNQYFDPTEMVVLTEVINSFDTPTEIGIYTIKADYEQDLLGGKWGIGAKASQVASDNTFLVYDGVIDPSLVNQHQSNTFDYDERVYAGYINYSRPINEAWQFSAGLRAEQTDATGDLKAFLPELQEPPVELNYLNWFPSAGLSWQANKRQTLALNYGRRINRPNYNVLNPFNNQLSQLSYEKGNPFLRPEIVNNLELGYTLDYRYTLKLAYSKTIDQITRLIGPDENDPRASFITWENLSSQTVWSMNLSTPIQINKWWSIYVNLNASHMDNQADYGDGAVVDVQAFTYNFYQQQTFTLPWGFKGEISGWYSGPGIWGGVFLYDPSWSLDLGLQKRFWNDKLNVRVNVTDIFYEAYWSGYSDYDGMFAEGSGNWDSRRASISVSYDMGNSQVKSRRRSAGMEDEAKRVGS